MTEIGKQCTYEEVFVKDNYFEKINKLIIDILSRPEKDLLTYDILDTPKTLHNKLSSSIKRFLRIKTDDDEDDDEDD